MKKTSEEIIKIINNYIDEEDGSHYEFEEGKFLTEELGESEMVFQKGGEDEGSDYRIVRHFKDHDVFIEVSGFYQSYNGVSEWYDFEEVFPVEKVVTFYESK